MARFPEFFPQKEFHLVIERLPLPEHMVREVLPKVFFLRELQPISRNPARDRIMHDPVLEGFSLSELADGGERHGLNLPLSRSPSVKGGFVSQDLRLHHADARSQQDEKNLAPGEVFVPSLLKQAGDSWIGLDQIGKLVNGKDESFIFVPEIPEGLLPGVESPCQKQRLAKEFADEDGKPTELFLFVRALGKEIEVQLALHEALDDFGLSDPALAPKDDKLGLQTAIFLLKKGSFPVS